MDADTQEAAKKAVEHGSKVVDWVSAAVGAAVGLAGGTRIRKRNSSGSDDIVDAIREESKLTRNVLDHGFDRLHQRLDQLMGSQK